MNHPPATVWHRTATGNRELDHAQLALTARLRQLLRLVDGRRDQAELMRLMALGDFDAQLGLLIDLGLIRADEAPRSGPPGVPESTFEALAQASAQATPQPTSPAPDVDPDDDLAQTRARMIGALDELIGEHGAPLAARLQRCTAVRELRELLPATLSIVEAVGGPTATYDFLERAGRI